VQLLLFPFVRECFCRMAPPGCVDMAPPIIHAPMMYLSLLPSCSGFHFSLRTGSVQELSVLEIDSDKTHLANRIDTSVCAQMCKIQFGERASR
jgi:hypothetical protein